MPNNTEIENRQDIRIVMAGHVDHGKSTVIGRLLADTDSLPQGKLDQIREKCRIYIITSRYIYQKQQIWQYMMQYFKA